MKILVRLVLVVAGLFALGACRPAADETIVVDSVFDTVDDDPTDGLCADSNGSCSLRAAVMHANTDPNLTAIELPNIGTGPSTQYALTIPGTSEDNAATGDLDILSPVYIDPAPGATFISVGSTNGLDRIFDFHTPSGERSFIADMTIFGGNVNDSGGAVYLRSGELTLEKVRVTGTTSSIGAVTVESTADIAIENSSFDGNTGQFGSNDLFVAGGTGTVFQTTMFNNTSSEEAVMVSGGGAVQITASTIVSAEGVNVESSGVVSLGRTVVDTTGAACTTDTGGLVVSNNNNLASDTTCALTNGFDTQGVAAVLKPLAFNGTNNVLSMLPNTGSPAVNTVDPDVCLADGGADVRLLPRGDYSCDKGAIEANLGEGLGLQCFPPFDAIQGGPFQNCIMDGLTPPLDDVYNHANFSGASLRNAVVNFGVWDSVDLRDADLFQATIINTEMLNADLRGVDFTGAVLSQSDLTGSNTTGAIFDNTICPDGSNSDNQGNTCVSLAP